MNTRITENDLLQGYETIKVIIDKWLLENDIEYKALKNAPSTYKEMVTSYEKHGIFRVYSEGDHGYFGKDYIIKFRAVHDAMHMLYDLNFNFEQEKVLSDITSSEFSSIAWNELNCTLFETYVIQNIMKSEIQGQIEYYEKHGDYVKDQKSFTKEYLQVV